MADDMDKTGQAGQGTIDLVKPPKTDEEKKANEKKKKTAPSCGPSGCSAEQQGTAEGS